MTQLKNPGDRVLSALAALEGNTNFDDVRAWLRESLNGLYAESVATADEVQCRWKQGAAQALEEFLAKADKAQEIVRKSRRP